MEHPLHSGTWFWWGVILLCGAAFLQNVTIAGGRYETIISLALVLTVLADLFFIQAFRRGGFVIRLFSILLALPTALFVVADCIRRAPYAFR